MKSDEMQTEDWRKINLDKHSRYIGGNLRPYGFPYKFGDVIGRPDVAEAAKAHTYAIKNRSKVHVGKPERSKQCFE